MFIKRLKISTPNEVLRDIEFHNGLNLIIDDTPTTNEQLTGNNVGKTTVLKLVDFCLGGNASAIYSDPENKKSIYKDVKDFLVDEEVLITLILTENLDVKNAKRIVIERNFLSRNKAIRTIDAAKKQAVFTKIKQEETYRERLEKKQTKNSYEIALAMIEDEIIELNEKKASFNLNENFEQDLDELNLIKYKINKTSSTISNLNIRKNLIEEAKNEMEQNITSIDLKQLELLYKEATSNIEGIQKTFENLVAYHNDMLVEKVRFITEDLPSLEEKINAQKISVSELL